MTDSTDDVDWYDGEGEPLDFDPKTEWKTKDGNVLKVRDMTDNYIVNASRHLLRKGGLSLLNRHPGLVEEAARRNLVIRQPRDAK